MGASPHPTTGAVEDCRNYASKRSSDKKDRTRKRVRSWFECVGYRADHPTVLADRRSPWRIARRGFPARIARRGIPALPGIKVIDTTGAGDIFGGSAVWRLLQTGKAPEELEPDELTEIVSFACTAAGLSTTRSGGISGVPEYAEVIEKMNR